MQYWTEHMERCRASNKGEQPLECTAFPGDVVFVPHGWWHMVINLDDTNCAITHNYVSPSNLGNVLKFFVDKQDQVSGCRDRAETIKPEHLHDALVEALSKVEPKYLQRAQEQKGWTCKAWGDTAATVTPPPSASKESVKTAPGGTSVMAKADKSASFSFSFL